MAGWDTVTALAPLALTRGGNTALLRDEEPVDHVRLAVTWCPQEGLDVDVSALLCDAQGRTRTDEDFVFYNAPEALDGVVRLLGKADGDEVSGDRLPVSLAGLPADVHRVVVLASLGEAGSGGFARVQDLALLASTFDEQPLTRFLLEGLSSETAVVLGELYRRDSGWRLRVIGQGYDSGLAGVARDYGVNVQDEQQDESGAAPAEPPPPGAVQDADVAEPQTVESPVDLVKPPEDLPEPRDQGLEAALPALAPRQPRTPGRGVRTARRTSAAERPLSLAEDETWTEQAARLFPVAGVGSADEQERRATSSLLAVLMGVREFGRSVASRLGAPAGVLEAYVEVSFPLGEHVVRPDGVLKVARAGRTWTALLEVKTGTSPLSRAQVESYLAVARERGYDAVVTISNELSAIAGEHPVGVDRRTLRKVALHHLSWAEVLHEATMQRDHRGVADPAEAWVLRELIRYLQHPRSGASGFEDMGSSWVPVRDAVATGTLRASNRKARDVAVAWERLVRQLCLQLTSRLGMPVTSVPPKMEGKASPHVVSLVERGVLQAAVRVRDAVGPINFSSDLRAGQVEASVELAAPQTGRPKTRVMWLLRQLADAPDAVRVEALTSRSSANRAELLTQARQDPTLLVPDSAEIRRFRISLTAPLGTKRGVGKGGFITSTQDLVSTFYGAVVQDLKAWRPPAPQLPEEELAETLAEATDDTPADQ